jgi:hypothetical protein
MQLLSRRFSQAAVFGLMAALGLLAARPSAAVGRRLDLATMTERAGTILSGRVTQIRAGTHPQYRNIGVLFVTLKVEEMMKGAPAETFTFMQFTGQKLDNNGGKGLSAAQPLPDMPSFRVGEEIVLFLYPPSSVGFTSPVGGEQGKFLVRRQPGQPTTVISEGGNRSLITNGSLPPRLTPDQQNLLRNPGDTIDFKTFRSTVKTLLKPSK